MRSQVQGGSIGSDFKTSKIRTSKNGWVQDSASPVISKLSKRVGMITGLETNTWKESSELLQVCFLNFLLQEHWTEIAIWRTWCGVVLIPSFSDQACSSFLFSMYLQSSSWYAWEFFWSTYCRSPVRVSFNQQVANYINGGHYSPHHDYVFKEKDPNHVSLAIAIVQRAPKQYQ